MLIVLLIRVWITRCVLAAPVTIVLDLERRIGAGVDAHGQHRRGTRHHVILNPRHQRSRRDIHNVLGRLARRVDPALPARHGVLRHRRQVEVECLPIGVEHQVKPERQVTRTRPNGAGKAVRILTPVRLAEPDAVPLEVGAAQKLVEARSDALRGPDLYPLPPSEAMGDRRSHEAMNIRMPLEQAPVQPADLVVLTIGVIVAPLGAAHLIAHQQHRGADRNQRRDDEVLHLAAAQLLDGGIFARPLDPAIPGPIVVQSRPGCLRRSPRCACRCRKPDRSA